MNNHLGNGCLFSDFVLVAVHPWVSLSCPEVQAPVAKHPWEGASALPLPPGETESGYSGLSGRTQQEATWPPFFRPMESSRLSITVSVVCPLCVRKKAPEADRKPSNRFQPLPHAQASENLLRSKGAGPRTAQRPKHQLAAGLSPQDHCYRNNRPLPDRETDRQTDR